MKKLSFSAITLMLCQLIFVFCGSNEEEPLIDPIFHVSEEQAKEYTAGDWKLEILPSGEMIPDSIIVDFRVNQDSTYSLLVIDLPEKIIFSHTGTWNASGDTMYLAGTECMALDTALEPDSLTQLPDSICSRPISIPMVLDTLHEPWQWLIYGSSLGAAIDAFPVSENVKNMVRQIQFYLIKQ
jgi:hypothetical protein